MLKSPLRISLGIFFLFSLLSCAPSPPVTYAPPTQPSPPAPPPEPMVSNFKFNYPEAPSQKMNITIGVVGVDWGKKPLTTGPTAMSPVSLSMNQELASDISTANRETANKLMNVLKDFDSAVKKEYESMMVRRGFDTMGFQNLNEMTYPQKQTCNLVLIPEFNFSINSEANVSDVEKASEAEGKATISGDIILSMLEPLSGQKVWMKRIPLKPEEFQFKTKMTQEEMNYKGQVWKRPGDRWDNRPQRLSKALSKFFVQVMQTSWNYFSPEEIAVMKKHSDEIRKLKRY